MSKINTRDRNANSVDKKPNWEYRFEAASVDGKRKQISKSGFRTKKEALEAGAKALAEYNNSGLHFEPSEISVSDYLDIWFEQYAKVNLKYSTQVNYEGIVNVHLKPTFGFYKLKSLNATVIQDYINVLKMKGMSKSSIVGILTTFSESLDYAIEPLHYLRENPARFVRMPKIEKQKRERIILTDDSWKTIINRFCYPSRFFLPLMIGYFCGLRISETFGLTWEDIDFDNREIKVNKQIIKRKMGTGDKKCWYFETPKTMSSKRNVKFGETLYNALIREKQNQDENRKKYGEFYTKHIAISEIDEKGKTIIRVSPIFENINAPYPVVNLICVDENGEYTSPDSFKYCARVIHYELKIKFDYHSLRHTHATRLIENGANVKDVQMRLGHENIETTLQTYVHDTEQMKNNTVDIFENFTKKQ